MARVLAAIRERPGIRSGELGAVVGLSRWYAQVVVDLLVRDGLVRRVKLLHDARGVSLHPTPLPQEATPNAS
jgi:DNA-binding MarR family transcriptional regulator